MGKECGSRRGRGGGRVELSFHTARWGCQKSWTFNLLMTVHINCGRERAKVVPASQCNSYEPRVGDVCWCLVVVIVIAVRTRYCSRARLGVGARGGGEEAKRAVTQSMPHAWPLVTRESNSNLSSAKRLHNPIQSHKSQRQPASTPPSGSRTQLSGHESNPTRSG